MTGSDVLLSALRGLSANKLRSSLTMLGILIGVAAVILLVAVGNGSAVAIQNRLAALGTNTLTVSGNSGFGALGGASRTNSQSLTMSVAEALDDPVAAPDVASVSPVQSTSSTIAYDGTSESVTVTGTVPSWFGATNTTLTTGSQLTTAQVEYHARVVILGSSTAEDLFPDGGARDRAEAACRERGIGTRRWYLPTIDRQPAFGHVAHLPTPVADAIGERLLGVPFYPGLGEDALDEIAAALSAAFG